MGNMSRIAGTVHPGNVRRIMGAAHIGREDRLARAGIALSLLLMAVFAVASSGAVGAISLIFGILGGYFALTAALGRDPIYTFFGVDTHSAHDARRSVIDLTDDSDHLVG